MDITNLIDEFREERKGVKTTPFGKDCFFSKNIIRHILYNYCILGLYVASTAFEAVGLNSVDKWLNLVMIGDVVLNIAFQPRAKTMKPSFIIDTALCVFNTASSWFFGASFSALRIVRMTSVMGMARKRGNLREAVFETKVLLTFNEWVKTRKTIRIHTDACLLKRVISHTSPTSQAIRIAPNKIDFLDVKIQQTPWQDLCPKSDLSNSNQRTTEKKDL